MTIPIRWADCHVQRGNTAKFLQGFHVFLLLLLNRLGFDVAPLPCKPDDQQQAEGLDTGDENVVGI